jgi:tetratricopeptide (TPR) repeat protein
MTENAPSAENGARLDRAKELVARGELSAALEELINAADRVATVNAHGDLAAWLYNSQKNPDAMLVCGHAGVRIGLAEVELNRRLKSAVQVLANNVAANCWPGWGDEGIFLTREQVKEGLALAETSLAILQEDAPTLEQLANGHWLIGALQFAAQDYQAALISFDLAKEANVKAGNRVGTLMNLGYRSIVLKRSSATAQEAHAELAKIISDLSEDGSKPAQFFVQQLRTADALL